MFRMLIPYWLEVEKFVSLKTRAPALTPVSSGILKIAVNQYCSYCSFLLEPDCDFCPSCGLAKAKSQHGSSNARDPHVWMKDPPLAQPVQSAPFAQPAPPVPHPVAATPQIQYVTYQVNGPTARGAESGLGMTVRTMGIVALSFMLVGFIPCLGWLNYINILLSFITLILGIVAIATAKSDADRSAAFLGVALVLMAAFLGTGRLILGGGCV
jgi:hypothetical protein